MTVSDRLAVVDPSDARLSAYDFAFAMGLASQDAPFYALIAAAMRGADTFNVERLKVAFPLIWEDLDRRYHAPGGLLPGEER